MTSQAFSFTSGTWASAHSLHPVVDDNYGSSGSGGVYRWDIQNSSSTEHVGSGYILQYDGSQSEPWSVSSSVWSGGATISRPSTGVIRVTAQSIDRGTWTETAAFLNGVMPSSGGGTSTEELLVENASMVFYAGVTGWRFEQRGYAAGDYSLIGGTVNESWTVLNGSNNLQHHISQIPAGGTYYLYSGSNTQPIATLSTITSKRVHCNFW